MVENAPQGLYRWTDSSRAESREESMGSVLEFIYDPTDNDLTNAANHMGHMTVRANGREGNKKDCRP